jgi:pimeloyl-ACP methyl ester carboxylesterase
VTALEQTWRPPGEGRSFVEGLEVLARLPPRPGGKPPILFVHGACHGAWCWDEHWMPEAAARGWPCYALSLRGHGASGSGRRRLVGDYLDDVWQVLIRLPAPPVLVGHSMGALLVSRVLARYPAPAGALLTPVGLRHGFGFGARVARRHPGDYLRGLALVPPAPGPDYLFARLDAAEARRLADRMVPESPLALYELHGPRRARPSKAPVLVMGAGDDAVIPPLDVVRTARHYGTRARFFRGMGHDLMLDRGWQRPLDVLLGWLEQTVQPRRTATRHISSE